VTTADGNALVPVTLEYATTVKAMGQEQHLTSTRTVTPAQLGDQAVWRVVDATTVMGMTAVDTLDVDRATLLPVRREVAGRATVSLRFTADSVNGEIHVGGRTMPVAGKLSAPAFTEGAGAELAAATLPLAPGYEGTIQVFALATQQVRPMKVTVTGTETLTTDAGTFQTYVVQVTPQDGNQSGTATYHVTQDAPHLVVKTEASMPSGSGESVLTSIKR
jgi:hypothetical protein